MKFKEYELVKILKNTQEDIKIGDIGVIIMVFDNPNEAYEVEIVNDEGNVYAQGTFLPDELELLESVQWRTGNR